MARTMEPQEIARFLSSGTRTAKLATVRPDGRPHVAPVWFLMDSDDVVLSTGEDTVKGRNLQADPRVSLSVDDQSPPYAFVVLSGIARLDRERDALLDWCTRLGERYMGADRAEEFGRRNAVPSELLVRITVEHVVAVADLSA